MMDTAAYRRIRTLSEIITADVCSNDRVPTLGELQELGRLEQLTGSRWDAINRRWLPLTCAWCDGLHEGGPEGCEN